MNVSSWKSVYGNNIILISRNFFINFQFRKLFFIVISALWGKKFSWSRNECSQKSIFRRLDLWVPSDSARVEVKSFREGARNLVIGTKVVRGRGGGRKLSDNPQKAWKQVTTGLKKWALRYLNNCYGMRKSKKPANRAKAMYERHVDSFPTSWQ